MKRGWRYVRTPIPSSFLHITVNFIVLFCIFKNTLLQGLRTPYYITAFNYYPTYVHRNTHPRTRNDFPHSEKIFIAICLPNSPGSSQQNRVWACSEKCDIRSAQKGREGMFSQAIKFYYWSKNGGIMSYVWLE